MFDGDYPIGIQGNEDAIAPFRDWLAQLCLCVPHVKEGFGYFPPHRNENAAVEPIAYPEHARTTPDIASCPNICRENAKSRLPVF